MKQEYIPDAAEFRVLPHSTESEAGLLGCLIDDAKVAMPRCIEAQIGAHSFHDLRHKPIFTAIEGMWIAGLPISTIGVIGWLNECKALESSGGAGYVTGLIEMGPTASNTDYHLSIVLDKATRRRGIEQAMAIIELAHSDQVDVGELLAKATTMARDVAVFDRGASLHLMQGLQDDYSEQCHRVGKFGLNLSKWLPAFYRLRPIIPGEMVVLLGATGIGKTALLSNLALSVSPIPTLFCQMELPKEMLFERLMALRVKMSCADIEKAYASGEKHGEDFFAKAFPNLLLCTSPKLTVADIENKIEQAYIKSGVRPVLVLVDYLGLIQGRGQSRYDRFSQIAEDLRLMAKASNTIVVVACQIGRKSADDGEEVHLTDGKESGSIENSASLVIGAWRDPQDTTLIHLKVLKSTKGGGGLTVDCNYNLDTLAITERAKYADQDQE